MMTNGRVSRSWIATALAVFLALLGAVIAPFLRDLPQAEPVEPTPLVVIGFSGVNWSYVNDDTAPNLAVFAEDAVLANLVVKTVGSTTCPNAGWMTINTGHRNVDPVAGAAAGGGSALLGGSASTRGICSGTFEADSAGNLGADFDELWAEASTKSPYAATAGPFGDQLALAGVSVGSAGSGGALAVRNSGGEFNAAIPAQATVLPLRTHVNLTHDDGVARDVVAAYEALDGHDLVVLDLGRVRDTHTDVARKDAGSTDAATQLLAAFSGPKPPTEAVLAQLKVLDTELGDVLRAVPADTNIMVISVADTDSRTARLQVFAMSGPAVEAGTLAATNSTRQDGLVQLTDIPQTILALLGKEPVEEYVGSEILVSGGEIGGYADVLDADLRASSVRPAVGPFYIFTVVVAGVFLIAALVIRRRPERLLGARMRYFGLFAAALPASSFLLNLVPWWRLDPSTIVFLGGVIALAALIAGIAMWSGRYSTLGPVSVVALVTAATIGIDAVFGSTLHASSVLGDQPQSGGRFYGLSNAPFTIFAVAMIVLTVIAIRQLKEYRAAVVVPAAIVALGIATAVIDGAPSVGADFGGPPAIAVAFLVLLFLALGRTFTVRRVLLIGAIGAGVAMAIAFADWLRPVEERTHLGRFFQDVIDGHALQVVYRKAGMLWHSVPWPVWIIVALVLVAVAVWGMKNREQILARPDFSSPDTLEMRWGVVAIATLAVVGVAINDSGLVIALFAIVFGMPLVIVAVDRLLADNRTGH
ncbi:MAG: alkaline phosphatase family protein [Actinomycetaceae bacterium]|nr:alkaline phosphatase family protein [Actinomycetaceae bacterium]